MLTLPLQIISQHLKEGRGIDRLLRDIKRAHEGLYHPRGYDAVETEGDDGDEADSLLATYRLGNEQLVYLLSKTYGMASVSKFYRDQEKVPSFLSCYGGLQIISMRQNLESFIFSRPALGKKCAWVNMVNHLLLSRWHSSQLFFYRLTMSSVTKGPDTMAVSMVEVAVAFVVSTPSLEWMSQAMMMF